MMSRDRPNLKTTTQLAETVVELTHTRKRVQRKAKPVIPAEKQTISVEFADRNLSHPYDK